MSRSTGLVSQKCRAITCRLTPVPSEVKRPQPGLIDLVTGIAPLLAMKIVFVETTSMRPSTFYLAFGRGRRKRGPGAFKMTIGPRHPPYEKHRYAHALSALSALWIVGGAEVNSRRSLT